MPLSHAPPAPAATTTTTSYRNDADTATTLHHYLRVRVQGRVTARGGYGAKVTATPAGGDVPSIQYREVGVDTGFYGQSETAELLHFGLGETLGWCGAPLCVNCGTRFSHCVMCVLCSCCRH